jgi:MinD-like ATPase involved in chromosome partitioning or flagellar assembly
MSLIALVGDCTTTTSLAIAASWIDEVVILEADRSGGSLTAWLDTPATPSLATIVANAPVSRSTIESMTQHSSAGIRFIAAPIRTRAATTAIDEAATMVFPELASPEHRVVLADVGRYRSSDRAPTVLRLAELIVICHRQEPASTAASSVRLDRLSEYIETLVPLGIPMMLAIIGSEPFDPDEIARFVDTTSPDALIGAGFLPDDPLSAAVLAGRTGVSAKRLRRLPLMRSAADVAATLHTSVGQPHVDVRGRAGSFGAR